MKDKIFVVPKNDLESREIIKLLEGAGYKRGENLFITNQGWGASWKGLEPEIKAALREKTDRFRITKVIPAGQCHGEEIRTEKNLTYRIAKYVSIRESSYARRACATPTRLFLGLWSGAQRAYSVS